MRAPPLFVSFSNLESLSKALSDHTLRVDSDSAAILAERGLPPAVSTRFIATLFGYSPKFLISLNNRTEKYYRTFTIRTGRKERVIQAPRVALKVIQKWLSHHWSNAIVFEDYVHGFVKGRSSLTAAKVHTNAKWVYSVDIRDFFPTTSMAKIIGALNELGYSIEASTLIAKLCCYRGNLAQGSPASPFLSNLAFKSTDAIISKLANTLGVRYTRYADDLVFSGIGDFPEEIKVIKNFIEAEGWRIAEEKEYFSVLPNRLKVHGLLVHENTPKLTKGYRNKIRAYKHLISTRTDNIQNKSIINGHIAYAASVDNLKDMQ